MGDGDGEVMLVRGDEPDVASAELLCLKLGQLSWVRMATLA